ncbi:uncharacterized protein LAESUDRAFT_660484 [Laetiporus sulphureus 93-53]|uniref:Carbohydrate kinase PfkB domain-containing protein n=1 Tax=Laetiporus sulphureus 93-53 TaxID=1314785 RepID=A0A165CLR7_9APHY|nr:uncharacterized protein LAESUDRAFT_660484 [Laetiporus sulphureus 93-53]KZT03037.1 hypothetical protein LAESUDRAFT_660484 [Laetiporus sulphureus 93-53]
MARLRRDTHDSALQRPLRVVASGTLFLTHTFTLPTHPEPSTVIRASSVFRSRGGSASTCLSILAQFPHVDAMLVAPLGGNGDGQRIIHDLENERVSTRFCKVWDEAGVPGAWVLHADDTGTSTVINNNPLPDIAHEEFVSLLGPLLAPENYAHLAPTDARAHNPSPMPQTSPSAVHPAPILSHQTGNSPAPFDWLHFEGRSVKTTLSNIMGVDGLARERRWRSHCVFSVDVGRRARQGVEALIPYADVLFLNKHYACAHSPQYAGSPRAFLLSLTALASPHALLVAHWGEDGAAALSVPTREYFQSSGWVGLDVSEAAANSGDRGSQAQNEVVSVRTGSDFWAGQHTASSSVYTAGVLSSLSSSADGESDDSDDTQVGARPRQGAKGIVDEVGAQDAFVAGMIFALSRSLLPGEPYTPSSVKRDPTNFVTEDRDGGKWRLEECLRFATELAGRKARRKGWQGLADEMARAGWFVT